MSIPLILSTIKLEHRNPEKAVCVDYPGHVVNVDKAIETLGGIPEISECFCSGKKLTVNFRPKNVYSKGATAEKSESTGLFIKVKTLRRGSEMKTKSVEVLGKVVNCYQFSGMADYQMLPILKKDQSSSQAELIYDDLLPDETKTSSWLEEPTSTPFFFPPKDIARSNATVQNLYRNMDTSQPRLKRIAGETLIVNFNLTDPVPTAPCELAVNSLKRACCLPDDIKSVKAIFEKRPIWSSTSILSILPIKRNTLWIILKNVAYYYFTGPWRRTWIRLGYDPRKDFHSRFYQILDLRLIKMLWLNKYITAKTKKKTPQEKKPEQPSTSRKEEGKPISFEIGKFPEGKIIFYQYCDIHVPKIQEMLQKVPSPLSGGKCTEKYGWLPPEFDMESREIMICLIKEHFHEELQKHAAETKEENNDEEEDFDDKMAQDELSDFEDEEMDIDEQQYDAQ